MSLLQEAIVASRFDALADRFKESIEPEDYRLVALREALQPLAGQLVLDLGCGKGRFSTALERMGAKVVGLDRSRVMLGRAGLDRRVLASGLRLPLGDGSFDSVCAVEVLQHLPFGELAGWLAEVRRVLRPGGRLVVIDRNLWSLDDRRSWLPSVALKRLDEHRGRWMYRARDGVRERWISPWRFQRMLNFGFEQVDVRLLCRPEEKDRWLFERVPLARRMFLGMGVKPGGEDG